MSLLYDAVIALNPSMFVVLDTAYGAVDRSGNGRDGSAGGGITIGAFQESVVPGELSTAFDGVANFVSFSYNPCVNGAARSYFGGAVRDGSTAGTLMGTNDATDANVMAVIAGTPGSSDLTFRASAVSNSIFSNALPAVGTWFHWILVFDETANAVTCYVNGLSLGTNVYTTNYSATPGNLQLGKKQAASTFFAGKQSYVGVVERAITPQEAQTVGSAPALGLVDVFASSQIAIPSWLAEDGLSRIA